MKKERNEDVGERALALVTLTGEGGACSSGGGEVQPRLPVSDLHLCDQKQHRALIFGGQAPFCPPWLQEVVSELPQEHVHNCLQHGWGWRIGSYCC